MNNYEIKVTRLAKQCEDGDVASSINLPGTNIRYTKYNEERINVDAIDLLRFGNTPDLDSLLPFIVSQLVLDASLYINKDKYNIESININRINNYTMFVNINIDSETDRKEVVYRVTIVTLVKLEHNIDTVNTAFRGQDGCGFDAGQTGGKSFKNKTVGEILNSAKTKFTEYAEIAEKTLNEALESVQESMKPVEDAINNEMNNTKCNGCTCSGGEDAKCSMSLDKETKDDSCGVNLHKDDSTNKETGHGVNLQK